MKKTKKQTTESQMKKVQSSSSNTVYDQDSDIIFMKDTDEEIDTGEIKEEDWIEYMKRSTATAVEKDGSSQNPMLD